MHLQNKMQSIVFRQLPMLPRQVTFLLITPVWMQLDTLTPDLPELLIEMGIKYDPDKLAAQLSSKWPQVSTADQHRSRPTASTPVNLIA